MDDTDADESVSRRGFLRTAAGTAAVAGASGTAAAQEGGSGGGSAKTVTVGPGGALTFEPAELTIAPGTSVKFTWGSSGHNVNPDSGKWGHQPIEDKGFSFTTPPFQQTGEHPYVCDPHESAGMTGTIIVQQGGASSGSSEPPIPGFAKSLGVAASTFLLSTLGLAYFFMRYGGDFEGDAE
ncbi:plastocyanin/azurin family copper-binding protein [Halococcus sp. AFM35]|uniref:plastocyanin/azurin family copper-binding protein n=1 Tax=Halococcus sp. AFM35 TaxID=3421653 RepID=UPI003EBA334A